MLSPMNRVIRAMVACVAALMMTVTCVAQGRGGGGGGGMGGMFGREAFDPPVTTQEIEAYAKMLGLSAEQKEAAMMLHESMLADFQPAARAARDKMEAARDEFRETRDPSVWMSVGEDMQKFRTQRTKAEADYMNNLRALLTPEQERFWPGLERQRRRERTVGRGMMSGERVDLIRMVDRMKLPEEQMTVVRPMLDEYAVELDRELIKRNEVYDGFEGRMRQIFGGGDMTEADEMMKKGREVSQRVRDVNRRFARQIESVLGDRSAEFAREFKRESFPGVYRQTRAMRVLDTAVNLKELDEAQKQTIEAIRDQYQRELAALQAEMEKSIETRENTADAASMMRLGMGDPAMQELRSRRRDMEAKMVERIESALTPAQRELLPSDDDREGGRDGEREGPRRQRGAEPR